MASLNDIVRLRAAEKQAKRRGSITALRQEFDRKKAQEWLEIEREFNSTHSQDEAMSIRREMAVVARELYENGTSKRAIGIAYGTKDARTINELIYSAPSVEDYQHIAIVPDAELEGYEDVQLFKVVSTQYGGFTGEIIVYADSDGDVVVASAPPEFYGTELHKEIAGGLTGDFNDAWSQAV